MVINATNEMPWYSVAICLASVFWHCWFCRQTRRKSDSTTYLSVCLLLQLLQVTVIDLDVTGLASIRSIQAQNLQFWVIGYDFSHKTRKVSRIWATTSDCIHFSLIYLETIVHVCGICEANASYSTTDITLIGYLQRFSPRTTNYPNFEPNDYQH